MKKFFKQLVCVHVFKPYSQERFFRSVYNWHPILQNYVLDSTKDDGVIQTAVCRCGKTKHDFFK